MKNVWTQGEINLWAIRLSNKKRKLVTHKFSNQVYCGYHVVQSGRLCLPEYVDGMREDKECIIFRRGNILTIVIMETRGLPDNVKRYLDR